MISTDQAENIRNIKLCLKLIVVMIVCLFVADLVEGPQEKKRDVPPPPQEKKHDEGKLPLAEWKNMSHEEKVDYIKRNED